MSRPTAAIGSAFSPFAFGEVREYDVVEEADCCDVVSLGEMPAQVSTSPLEEGLLNKVVPHGQRSWNLVVGGTVRVNSQS